MNGLNSSNIKAHNIDLIVSWPKHLDFPLWRKQIREYRRYFKNIIIVFTDMNVSRDYMPFVKRALEDDRAIFVYSYGVRGEEDWRNRAVNLGLKYALSDWVLFTEEDFFWKEGFWDDVKANMGSYDYLAAVEGGRVHPCFILLKRELLDTTSKDFSVIRNVSDHFSKFTNELSLIPRYDIPSNLWHHMSGLSQNLYIAQSGGAPNYKPEEFAAYCGACLSCGIDMPRDFTRLFKKYENIS